MKGDEWDIATSRTVGDVEWRREVSEVSVSGAWRSVEAVRRYRKQRADDASPAMLPTHHHQPRQAPLASVIAVTAWTVGRCFFAAFLNEALVGCGRDTPATLPKPLSSCHSNPAPTAVWPTHPPSHPSLPESQTAIPPVIRSNGSGTSI